MRATPEFDFGLGESADMIRETVERFADAAHATFARGGKLLACGSAAELRAGTGASADTHLDQVFRSLVQASDPEAAARTILG